MKPNCKYVITEMQVQNDSLYLYFLYPAKKDLMSVDMVLPVFLYFSLNYLNYIVLLLLNNCLKNNGARELLTVALYFSII